MCQIYIHVFVIMYIYVTVCIIYKYIVLGRVFTNGLGDQGSIPGRVMPKTQKIVLGISLFNTQHYKVHIKSKMEQSKEEVVPFLTPCFYND